MSPIKCGAVWSMPNGVPKAGHVSWTNCDGYDALNLKFLNPTWHTGVGSTNRQIQSTESEGGRVAFYLFIGVSVSDKKFNRRESRRLFSTIIKKCF